MPLTVNRYTNRIKITGTTAASTAVSTEDLQLEKIYWDAPTTAGHKLSLTDKYGDPVIELTAFGNGTSVLPISVDVNTYCYGVSCDDLDSGTVFLYVQRSRK